MHEKHAVRAIFFLATMAQFTFFWSCCRLCLISIILIWRASASWEIFKVFGREPGRLKCLLWLVTTLRIQFLVWVSFRLIYGMIIITFPHICLNA